jgi:hypothetical protein
VWISTTKKLVVRDVFRFPFWISFVNDISALFVRHDPLEFRGDLLKGMIAAACGWTPDNAPVGADRMPMRAFLVTALQEQVGLKL